MNGMLNLRPLAVLLGILVLTACATTRPVGEWRDQNYSGKVNNLLIIGITSRSTGRRVFEDLFVRSLAIVGVSAIPSYELITSSQNLSRETVVAAIEARNVDGVLVTRLIGVKEEEAYRQPGDHDYYATFDEFYPHAQEQDSSGYYSRYRILTLETNLYETRGRALIWSMQSETMDRSQPRHIIENQINLTISNLREQGLI